MERITADVALRLLEQVVEERGEDYVYQHVIYQLMPAADNATGSGCVYVQRESIGSDKLIRSCGVGGALINHGVAATDLVRNNSAQGLAAGYSFSHLLDTDALDIFEAFQDVQDMQLPYADAIKAARHRHKHPFEYDEDGERTEV